jgi:hypothetical protein
MKFLNNIRNFIKFVIFPLQFAVLFFVGGLVVGGLWFDKLGAGWTATTTSDNILKDTLTIVLSVASVAIVIFGAGAFFLLRELLQKHVTNTIKEEYSSALARSISRQGFILHRQYLDPNDKDVLLELAIRIAEEAHRTVENLDESKKENEELLADLRNNWAYYLAFKPEPTDDDSARALTFASYLEAKISRIPQRARSFRDTIDVVREKFGS